MNLASRLVDGLRAWPVASQHLARRNALLAATELARLRTERDELETALETAIARHAIRKVRRSPAATSGQVSTRYA